MGITNDIAKLNAMQGLPQDNKTKIQAQKGEVKQNSVFGNGFSNKKEGEATVTVKNKGTYSGEVNYNDEVKAEKGKGRVPKKALE